MKRIDTINPDTDTLAYTPEQLCSRIAMLTGSIMDFWANGGWAPQDASALLSKSMLHWQSSLAGSLARWIGAASDGDLILAWANLGVLVEGQLKLFLCVHYEDYKKDMIRIHKKSVDPDGCTLEPLRKFFARRIWNVGTNWNPYVEMVQRRRNAIHGFRSQDIGTFCNWTHALRLHLSFVRHTGGSLPYPDEQFAGLREE